MIQKRRIRLWKTVISKIAVLVDGTGPEIHVPKEKVTVRPGDVFSILEDVYGVDSICPDEDCLIEIDLDELQKLADAMQSARAGTYDLTYYATDLAGNVGSKTIKFIKTFLCGRKAVPQTPAVKG